MPILIPGIGKQGGDIKNSVLAGINEEGTGILLNASRSILFSAEPKKDYVRSAHDEAKKIHLDILDTLKQYA